MNLVENFNKKKNLLLKKINIYNLTFILLIFILDRLSKNKIINNFSEKTQFINDFINLDLIWNTGIGFGLLSSDSPIIYNLVTILIGIVILVLFYFSIISEESDKLIFSIIIGGALGNYYDRLFVHK